MHKIPSTLANLAFAAVPFAILACVPLFIESDYVLFVLSTSAVFAIIASGLNITNGYIGFLNLAVGGIVATGAYVAAALLVRGMTMPAAILCAALVGGLVAAVIFLMFVRLRGFFFGLATIAAAEVIRLLIRNLDGLTQGVRGLKGYPKLTSSAEATYWTVLALLFVVLAVVGILVRSQVGLQWRAIRDNRDKALSMGIPVTRLQFWGYVTSGVIIAFGGALYAVLLQFIEPNIAGLATLVQTILMVTLGGVGTIVGPVLGAFVINLLPEVLRMADQLRLVIYGVSLIVVVLVLPGGIVGTVRRHINNRKVTPAS
jgi:branched-chain amino acid transport system permease protein